MRLDQRYKLTGMRKLFYELRDIYGLMGTEIIFPTFAVPEFVKYDNCRALFVPKYNVIVLRDRRIYPRNIRFVLHEMCHALQFQEGRLLIPRNHTRRAYALELEAEIFSQIEYRRLLESTFGKGIRHEWDMSSYEHYFQNKKEEMDTMEPQEVYQFVKSLDGATKRPILRRLDRRYPNKKDWEQLLCQVAA